MVIKGSDFQSYHIIIFNCQPFNQKIIRQSNKQESMANSKEKKLINRKQFWKRFDGKSTK